MKLHPALKILVRIIVLALIIAALRFVPDTVFHSRNVKDDHHPSTNNEVKNKGIHLAVVACGRKTVEVLHEAMTMIKSAVLFSDQVLNLHIFTDTLSNDFMKEFSRWPERFTMRLNITVHPADYPLPAHEKPYIANWFAPCCSFRLFLPEVLDSIDSILYVDTDVIFLGPVEDIWRHLNKFDSMHVGALAPRMNWVDVSPDNPNFIPRPDGKVTQVNSGVFLMNLTRLRQKVFRSDRSISSELHEWSWKYLKPIYVKNKKHMLGDQNLINTVFYYNPDLLYYLPCKYNYHHKICFDREQEIECESGEISGASLVHGIENTFHSEHAPPFAAVYKAFQQYNFEEDMETHLLKPMIDYLADPKVVQHERCGGKAHTFTRRLQRSIMAMRKRKWHRPQEEKLEK